MKTYPWACLACEETNAAGALKCARCACPAQATSAEVEAARSAHRRRAGMPEAAVADPFAIAMELPLLPIGAALFAFLGALMLIVDMGASSTAFGGLLLALAALCLSSWRKPAPAAR